MIYKSLQIASGPLIIINCTPNDCCGSVRTFTSDVDDWLRNYIGKQSFKNVYFIIAYNPYGVVLGGVAGEGNLH